MTWDKEGRFSFFTSGALVISLVYLTIGLIWVLISDLYVYSLGTNNPSWLYLSTLKGFAFIMASALLIYAVIRYYTKETEQQQHLLVQSEERLRNALEGATDAVWEWHIPTGNTYFSPRYYTMLGYEPEEFPQHASSWENLIHPGDHERVVSTLRQSMETGNEFHEIEYRIRTKAGDYRWVLGRGKTLEYDRSGAVVKMTGTNVDITDRKLAEENLKQNEERLRMAQAIGHTGCWEYVPSSLSIWGSAEARKIFGLSPDAEEFPIKELENCIQEHEQARQALRDLITEGKEYNITYTINPADGSPRKILNSVATRICDERGKTVRVMGVIHDITQQKIAESQLMRKHEELNAAYERLWLNEEELRQNYAELAKSQQDLITSRERLALALEGADEWFWDLRLDTGEVSTGQRGCEILGYTAEELSHISVIRDVLMHPDDKKTVDLALHEYLEGKTDIFQAEHRLKIKSGEWRWILTRGKVVARDAEGRPQRVTGTHTDITERKHQQKALRIANQKLQLMNMVAMHDIQNKITGLRGYVELTRDMVTDSKAREFIRTEDEILKVIHRQIQYTKEYQEIGMHPPVWIHIREMLHQVIALGGYSGLAFFVDTGDLELYCDPVIQKVFIHLIENTRRHGRHATEIRIRYCSAPDGLTLIYEDNGYGIPADRKKDIFNRDIAKEAGFSLFFVHDILESADMEISETGDIKTGVRFEIAVPRGLFRFGKSQP